MSIEIRVATADDAHTILKFITELAIFEKAEHEVLATEQTLKQTLFCPSATAYAVIAFEDNLPVGFAVYFFNYSTWLGKNGMYLEDLYVSQAKRNSGIGKLLLKHLAKIAVDKNCGRFEWSVLDWNEPAIQFYRSIGAQSQDEWIGYRLSGDALLEFANNS